MSRTGRRNPGSIGRWGRRQAPGPLADRTSPFPSGHPVRRVRAVTPPGRRIRLLVGRRGLLAAALSIVVLGAAGPVLPSAARMLPITTWTAHSGVVETGKSPVQAARRAQVQRAPGVRVRATGPSIIQQAAGLPAITGIEGHWATGPPGVEIG